MVGFVFVCCLASLCGVFVFFVLLRVGEPILCGSFFYVFTIEHYSISRLCKFVACEGSFLISKIFWLIYFSR